MRDYEPPTIQEGTVMGFDESEIYPGVKGYAVEKDGFIMIPMIAATEEGHGAVGEFLDRISSRCRVVNVCSLKLVGMLQRRNFKMTEILVEQFDEMVDVWEPPE
ncbi:hypothetical protein LCGC14_2477320 [marine sediment metagenome]|uniref:Uncharacterized protein n=1 Tax=marine sediment metagenome TaxID=412755 RepID=A0A0F9DKQ4_9ZZZZ